MDTSSSEKSAGKAGRQLGQRFPASALFLLYQPMDLFRLFRPRLRFGPIRVPRRGRRTKAPITTMAIHRNILGLYTISVSFRDLIRKGSFFYHHMGCMSRV